MTTDSVTPMPTAWTQKRTTKLGHATIVIVQVQDLHEATVSFVNENCETFTASETFGDARSAFHWGYGLKQSINDDFAAYTRQGTNLVENRPKKGKIADIITISNAIASIRYRYDNFALGHTGMSKGDTISVSQIKSSSLLSDEEKIFAEKIFQKLGKAVNNA